MQNVVIMIEIFSVKYTACVRHCTKSIFIRKHTLTGEVIDLNWLCYSEATGKLYRFVCKLLSTTKSLFTI